MGVPLGEGFRIPAAAHHPRAIRTRGRPVSNARLYGVERQVLGQGDVVQAEAAVDEVYVRIVEARKERATLGVEDDRLRTAQAKNLAVAADTKDLVPSNRDRLCEGACPIGCVDLGVVDDEVHWPVGVVALRAHDQPGDQRGRHDSYDDVCGETGRHATSAARPNGRAGAGILACDGVVTGASLGA